MIITKNDIERRYVSESGLIYTIDDVMNEEESPTSINTIVVFHLSEEYGCRWEFITPLGCLSLFNVNDCDFKEWVV